MGADFYPRLTAIANRNEDCNRLVNEQAEIGLLMAGPGILATLTLAPIVITVFYRGDFAPGRGNPALDLPGHATQGRDVAHGVHHSCSW